MQWQYYYSEHLLPKRKCRGRAAAFVVCVCSFPVQQELCKMILMSVLLTLRWSLIFICGETTHTRARARASGRKAMITCFPGATVPQPDMTSSLVGTGQVLLILAGAWIQGADVPTGAGRHYSIGRQDESIPVPPSIRSYKALLRLGLSGWPVCGIGEDWTRQTGRIPGWHTHPPPLEQAT